MESDQQLAWKVLTFSTGLRSLPAGGFENLGQPLMLGHKPMPFSIELIKECYMPIAQTCLN